MIVAPLRTTGLQGITDLTVVATVKDGFVPGAYGRVSYLARLSRVLAALDAVRRASREPALQASPFADLVGRFRGIHFFRFATLPALDASNPHRFLLNVTFDGGWEPYMRVIWGPLGTLLDLMFCNCVEYPLAHHSSFDDYMAWVRKHERPAGFFYADSAATVADAHYLRLAEQQQRNGGAAADADQVAAGLALPGQVPSTIPSDHAVLTALRVLKTYAGMRAMFPPAVPLAPPDPKQDSAILYRFTQDLLRDLRGWVAHGLFDPGQRFDRFRAAADAELRWLMTPTPARYIEPERKPLSGPALAAVQTGIAGPYPAAVRHGVLVLLRVSNAALARAWLDQNPPTAANAVVAAGGLYRHIAITLGGLAALGVDPKLLKTLPREFREGMEARAGVLGDLRVNHPANWRRPRRNWPQAAPAAGPEIQLGTVHLVLQLRSDQPVPSAAIAALEGAGTGLAIQHVQPMQLRALQPGESAGRDWFGFVDGLSQPTLSPPPQPRSYWSDQVKPGELFLGYGNSRGDGPYRPGDARNTLLDDGSFMVLRKLRQYPERLDALADAAAEQLRPNATNAARRVLADLIKAKMMGRELDGTPLVQPPGAGGNDFDYRNDARGAQCPFQAHIRRANPREALPLQLPPRIARRGMSWSANQPPEYGLMFIAYNASIAEQFEVIQRWLTGANSSGISSEQNDAMLGVPEPGQRRTYRFVHEGEVMRVDLGQDPLVTLEWGLYAFVPSLAAIRAIAAGGIVPPADPVPPVQPDANERWRQRLDDDEADIRQAAWDWVRTTPGGLRHLPGYGWLVADPALVREVLQDDGARFSAVGYGDRMQDSIGRGFLGMDDVPPNDGHQTQSPVVNTEIENQVPEPLAYDRAYLHASQQLMVPNQPATPTPVDLVALARLVIAKLCAEWFGLPDGDLMKAAPASEDPIDDGQARCPAHLLTASRSIFAPNPSQQISAVGNRQGILVREAVTQMLRRADNGQFQTTALVDAIRAALPGNLDLQARTIAGVMTGFPATVLGSLVSVLIKWVGSGQLWELQQALPLAPPPDHATADGVLRQPLLETLMLGPVPHVVWRTAAQATNLGGQAIQAGDKIIVSLKEAAASAKDPMLLFGGQRLPAADPKHIPHACSGYPMAMGTMLGLVAALLGAGTLAPSADPRVLMLSRP